MFAAARLGSREQLSHATQNERRRGCVANAWGEGNQVDDDVFFRVPKEKRTSFFLHHATYTATSAANAAALHQLTRRGAAAYGKIEAVLRRNSRGLEKAACLLGATMTPRGGGMLRTGRSPRDAL